MPLKIPVSSAMIRLVDTVAESSPVEGVLSLLADPAVNAVVVVNAENEPLGIITARDLLPRIIELEPPHGWLISEVAASPEAITEYLGAVKKAAGHTARELMSSPVLCIPEDTSVAEAAALMIQRNFKQLPVCHEGRLVGLLRTSDVLKVVADAFDSMEAG